MPPPASRRRRREPPPEEKSLWAQLLDVLELSGPRTWQILGLVLGIGVVGFGPLLLLALLDVSGPTRRALVALGPVSICLCLAGLVLWCGRRYGASLGWSPRQVTMLTALFAGLGVLGGVGLWLSES